IEPNIPPIAVAQQNGILADELCRASAPDVYVAGDVANQRHPLFGRIRVEHYNNAEKQGAAAARSMLGRTGPYDDLHSFWSDQYEHKIEYVGHVAKWDEFVVRGSLEEGKLIGLYLVDGVGRAAVGLDRGGDPELDLDSEMAACARLVAARGQPAPAVLPRHHTGLGAPGRRRGAVLCGPQHRAVPPADGGQRAVQQRDDQLPDVVRGQARPQRRIGAAQHLGVDGARAQADGADAVLLALDRDRLGQADDPVLGHVVRGQPGELLGGVDAGQRPEVDDPALTGGSHGGQRGAAAQEGARQVYPDRLG